MFTLWLFRSPRPSTHNTLPVLQGKRTPGCEAEGGRKGQRLKWRTELSLLGTDL